MDEERFSVDSGNTHNAQLHEAFTHDGQGASTENLSSPAAWRQLGTMEFGIPDVSVS